MSGYANDYIKAETIGIDLMPQFLLDLDARSQATTETYKKALRQFFVYLQEKKIDRPETIDIKRYRDTLENRKKSPVTVQSYLTVVRKFFVWTEQRGIYPNIAAYVKGVKIDKEHEVKAFLPAEQIKHVLDLIDTDTEAGKRSYAMVLLAVTTGLLGIELTRITYGDMKTLDDQRVIYIQGKGCSDKNKFVILPKAVEDTIQAYLATRRPLEDTAPLFARLRAEGPQEPLTTRCIRYIIKSAFKAAGIEEENISTQSLRHSAGMLALMHAEPTTSVMEHLRFNTLASTLPYVNQAKMLVNTCSHTVAEAIISQDEM